MKKAVAIVVLAAGVVVIGQTQAVTGKWASDPIGGGVLGLDLTISGTTLTGTVVATQPGDVFSSSIANGSVSGNTIAFSATIAGRTAAFTGEVVEDQITLRMVGNSAAPAFILRRVQVLPGAAAAAVATTSMPLTAPGGWRSATRSAQLRGGGRAEVYPGRTGTRGRCRLARGLRLEERHHRSRNARKQGSGTEFCRRRVS